MITGLDAIAHKASEILRTKRDRTPAQTAIRLSKAFAPAKAETLLLSFQTNIATLNDTAPILTILRITTGDIKSIKTFPIAIIPALPARVAVNAPLVRRGRTFIHARIDAGPVYTLLPRFASANDFHVNVRIIHARIVYATPSVAIACLDHARVVFVALGR